MSKIALEGIHEDIRSAINYYNLGKVDKLFFKLKSLKFQIPKLKKKQKDLFTELEKMFLKNRNDYGMKYAICEKYLERIIFFADKYGMYLPEIEAASDIV